MKKKEEVSSDVRDLRNDLQEIKTDTSTINRILTMAHSDIIEEDLKEIIGTNPRIAIIPIILSEKKTLTELSQILGIAKSNVYRYINPFLDKKYLYTYKSEGESYYKRVELFDKLNYEKIPEIKELIKKWYEENKDE